MVRRVSLLPVRIAQGQIHSTRPVAELQHHYKKSMKAELVHAASKVIPNQGILVNMLSRRVRQLMQGHRPLVEHAPGMRAADIALTEIASGKLTFESTAVPGAEAVLPAESTKLVEFPGAPVGKRKAA